MVHVAGFELIDKVADRSTGEVWKARDLELDRLVTLKRIVTGTPGALDRLRAQCAVLADLEHPNLVAVEDVLDADDCSWLVSPWVDGAALTELDGGPLNAQQAVALIIGPLRGLALAHAADLVHGDICAVHILLATDGTSRLIDFGLAGPSGATGVPPTSGFTSPEAAGGQPVTPASDVYSAAAVLARLLAGISDPAPRTPEEALTDNDAPERPALREIGGPVREVLSRALAAEPSDRYPSAAEFLAALEEAAERAFGPGWLGTVDLSTLFTAPPNGADARVRL